MRLVPLTSDYELTVFDCGDDQLNNFLYEDAKPSLELRIANTFILEDHGQIVAFFCLLNDKVSKEEIIGSRWKKIKNNFPRDKQFCSYPTVKAKLKTLLRDEGGRSAFRYITVDAYLSAVPFYEKNGFVHLTKKDEDEHTRLMFYDIKEVG